MKTERGTYEIKYLGALEAAVAKLNKRAIKNGLELVRVEVVREFMTEEIVEGAMGYTKTGRYVKQYEVRLHAPLVKIEGWVFVAKVEHREAGNVVSKSPNFFDDPMKELWTVKPLCEHCNKERKRNETFLLRRVGGLEQKRVGRQCLRDFMGVDLEAQMWHFEAIQFMLDGLESEKEPGGSGGYREKYFKMEDFLACANTLIRNYGYKKGVTGYDAYVLCEGRPLVKGIENPKVTDADVKAAKAALAWVKNEKADSDYIHNLQLLVNERYVSSGRHFGLVASLLPYHYKKTQQAADEAKRASLPQSQYVGAIGERIKFEAVIEKVISYEGSFGVGAIVCFRDSSGNELKWFTNPGFAWKGDDKVLNEGDSVSGVGRVKSQEEYKGRKQTILTRCKLTKKEVAK